VIRRVDAESVMPEDWHLLKNWHYASRPTTRSWMITGFVPDQNRTSMLLAVVTKAESGLIEELIARSGLSP